MRNGSARQDPARTAYWVVICDNHARTPDRQIGRGHRTPLPFNHRALPEGIVRQFPFRWPRSPSVPEQEALIDADDLASDRLGRTGASPDLLDRSKPEHLLQTSE